MSATSVRPRSAADCLIRSAVDVSHTRQQGNPPASSSAVWAHRPSIKGTKLLFIIIKAIIIIIISGSVRSDIIIGLGAGTVGEGGNPSLVSSMPPGVVPGPVDSASAPPSSGRGNYLPTQSEASYHSASSSPLARCPSSGFYSVNEAMHTPRWSILCPTLRWGWVFLERTRILSGIKFTTHFIESFVVETKRFVCSTVNVILTRQTCGQRSSRAAESKHRALEIIFWSEFAICS